jgi:ATP-binding protein involved in chromosome partitioning
MWPLTWSWVTPPKPDSGISPDRRRQGVAGVGNVSVNVTVKIASHSVQRGVQLLPDVKNIIAVASARGGDRFHRRRLALALAAEGASVGLLDA